MRLGAKKVTGLGAATASLAALSLVLSPGIAATSLSKRERANSGSFALSSAVGFTPAVADPRLAAVLARRGSSRTDFQFTPATPSDRATQRQVRVAVRARAETPASVAAAAVRQRGAAPQPGGALTAITPTSYNLGAAVGWKRFAITGDVAKTDDGLAPTGRESAEVGVNYSLKRFTGRIQAGVDRADGRAPRLVANDAQTSFDLRGAYRVKDGIEVTAGARYRIERDRLAPLADNRRDSQAVYVGTAFKF